MSSTHGEVSDSEPSSPEPSQQALGLESPQQLSVKQEDSKAETNFTSQPLRAPSAFSIPRSITPMSASVEAPEASTSAQPPIETPAAPDPYKKPTFSAANPKTPTRNELVTYTTAIQNYVTGMRYTLHFLNNPADTWPSEISLSVNSTVRAAATIWRAVAIFGEYASQWERHVGMVHLNTARVETSSARAASAQPSSRVSRLKTPLPTKYDGKKGDPASTFATACTNYWVMEPSAFTDDNQYIRWVLQQMDGKAGLWAMRQFTRMEAEKDINNRPPKELRKMVNFWVFFMTQFGDKGLIDKARVKWNMGFYQTGRALEYFDEVETILLCLGYPRDANMTMDKVIMGLKSHIQTHFIGRTWITLNDLKDEAIHYDAAYWEINKLRQEKDTKKTWTKSEKGKEPAKTAEVSRMGGLGLGKGGGNGQEMKDRRWLSPDKFEECKKNFLCFKCFGEGKRIKGSAHFHPNHLPQNTPKTTKIAATTVSEKTPPYVECLSDTDCDEKSKN